MERRFIVLLAVAGVGGLPDASEIPGVKTAFSALEEDAECAFAFHSDCALSALQVAAKPDMEDLPTLKIDWGTNSASLRIAQMDSGAACEYHVCDQVEVGPSKCYNGRCLCETGWRGQSGKCIPADEAVCAKNTGGDCKWWGCENSRGPVDCQNGECICQPGHCAIGGRCEPVREVFQGCSMSELCNETAYGPVSCEGDTCLCQEGNAVIAGRCQKVAAPNRYWR
eukprot:TRINITY_DN109993_c0_g1_i1.p1 TRINITY_DN109993_c0_g1~~TRINITY_DN109993_c0_g1_i1.p1  ORF type:complete len:225 (+),score=26.87 TRINITY_DN109993_c0_g1_i1:27-701(+)